MSRPKKDPSLVKSLTRSVRMTEDDLERIVSKYGSLQKWFDLKKPKRDARKDLLPKTYQGVIYVKEYPGIIKCADLDGDYWEDLDKDGEWILVEWGQRVQNFIEMYKKSDNI